MILKRDELPQASYAPYVLCELCKSTTPEIPPDSLSRTLYEDSQHTYEGGSRSSTSLALEQTEMVCTRGLCAYLCLATLVYPSESRSNDATCLLCYAMQSRTPLTEPKKRYATKVQHWVKPPSKALPKDVESDGNRNECERDEGKQAVAPADT